jgi:outer membrane protein OmpA-like peptidoglycan-associated protein
MHRLAYPLGLGLLIAACCLPTSALAQSDGVAIDRFDPAEHGSNWFSGESLDLRGHLRPAVGLTLDWAHEPLVLYDANDDEVAAIVQDQVFAHLGGGVVLWDRVHFGLNLPIQLVQSGDPGTIDGTTLEASGNAAVGDLRLGGHVRLLGKYGDLVTLAAGLQLYLPTGSRDAYTGDGAVRLVPRVLVAGDVAQFAYSARASVAYRAQDDGLGNIPTGSELGFVATAGVRVLDRKLLLGPELWGSTVFEDFFAKATTPFELMFGGHYTHRDWIFGLGVGPGLTRGFGAPAFRVLASVEWFPAIEEKEAPPPEVVSDRDGDGVLDEDDACPDLKGVRTGDPRTNGCPADRDADGVLDADDACPDTPGVRTGDPKTNGCPADRDGDGVLDADDACPDTPGVHTDDPQTNGCPGDRDKDTITDADDACPDEPGVASSDPTKNGCPKARVEQKEIKILDRIEFETNSDKIRPESEAVLEAVRAILAEHSEITRVSVEGHTDNVGSAGYNKSLSQRRAAAVMQWLIDKGIARARLEAHGLGLERPIADNATEEGRQENRRVEFHIIKTAAAADAASTVEEN